jgi:hypothetical protein
MEKIHLPFDEPIGSKIAQDYSGNGHHATIMGADYFTGGRQGNSLFTFHDSVTQVATNPINFNQNFTMYFFAYSPIYAEHPSELVFYVTFSGSSQVLKLFLNTDANSWTFITLVRSGTYIISYASGKQQDFFNIPSNFGNITSVICARDYPGGEPGYFANEGIMIDEFAGLDKALTIPEIISLISNYTTTLAYEFNGRNLLEFGVNVKDIRGHLGLPDTKEREEYSWPEEHGLAIKNETVVRYNRRTIELDVFFKFNSRDEAIDKTMELKMLLTQNPYQRFVFRAASRLVPYDVQVLNGFDFEIPRWYDGGAMAEFTVTLTENRPVKRVLKFVRTSDANKQVNISMNTNKHQFFIFWGDGTYTKDVNGSAASVSHEYDIDGEYLINVYGVIENVTNFNTNAITVWPRFF